MNDRHDLEVDALSAYVDGLATPDERALVERSERLLADAAGYEALREQLRDVPVPPAARDAALAAALGAFDQDVAGGASLDVAAVAAAAVVPPGPGSARVVRIDERRRWRRAGAAFATAAAAVAVLVGVSSLGGGDDDADLAGAPSDARVAVTVTVGGGDADEVTTMDDALGAPAAGGASPEAATEAAEAPPTIGAIPGSAEVRTLVTDPVALGQLRDGASTLATTAASETPGAPGSGGAATTEAGGADAGGAVGEDAAACAAPGDGVVLREILYGGDPATAVAAVAVLLPDGAVEARALGGCDVLARAEP